MQSKALSWLWGFAMVLDFLCQPFGGQPHEILPLVLAALLVCMPGSQWVLLLVSVADLTHFLAQSPYTPNHAVMRAFVDLALIGHFFLNGRAAALESSKPVIRILLILVYGISAFHKWNHDFLNPQVSCASQMLAEGAIWLALPNPSAAWRESAIWGALVCETSIPLLLIWDRSLKLALWLGVAFHSVLALHPHPGIYSFSGLAIAILALWVSDERWGELIGRFSQNRQRNALAAARVAIVFAAGAVLIQPDPKWTFRIGLLLWFACAAACAWALSALRGERKVIFRLGWFPAMLLLVFTLNGFAPYMGLQTLRVFSMFSNLRTEGGVSNHLLIRTDMQSFSFQRDLVEVQHSTDPDLNHLAGKGEEHAFFELQRWAQVTPKPFELTVRRRDGKITTETDETIPQPNSIMRKFLFFRAVDTSGPSKCRW